MIIVNTDKGLRLIMTRNIRKADAKRVSQRGCEWYASTTELMASISIIDASCCLRSENNDSK